MKTPRRITTSELSAYVDGELDEPTRKEVEAWLPEHPDDAERVREYRGQNEALHRTFDPVMRETFPSAMREAVLSSRSRRRNFPWLNAAAAILLFFAGGGAGWGMRASLHDDGSPDPVSQFATRAIGAHAVYVTEVKHPVEVGAEQENHLVKWLSKRLGHPLRTPDLGGVGFQLVGGRLLPDLGKAAAQFMYEDSLKRRLTVYVRPYDGENMAFRFTTEQDTATFYWIDSPFAYALSGRIPRERLLELAHLVYGGLYDN